MNRILATVVAAVIAGGVPHEVTTFRRDVETFGRHATVAFSGDVTEDAKRRDFTMNALYALPSGEVVDPLGGLPDLQARRVRFVLDEKLTQCSTVNCHPLRNDMTTCLAPDALLRLLRHWGYDPVVARLEKQGE